MDYDCTTEQLGGNSSQYTLLLVFNSRETAEGRDRVCKPLLACSTSNNLSSPSQAGQVIKLLSAEELKAWRLLEVASYLEDRQEIMYSPQELDRKTTLNTINTCQKVKPASAFQFSHCLSHLKRSLSVKFCQFAMLAQLNILIQKMEHTKSLYTHANTSPNKCIQQHGKRLFQRSRESCYISLPHRARALPIKQTTFTPETVHLGEDKLALYLLIASKSSYTFVAWRALVSAKMASICSA